MSSYVIYNDDVMDSIIYNKMWHVARSEHAWLLRAEGLKYRQIGVRCGVCKTTAHQMVKWFGRRMSRAMRYVKVREHE